MIFENKLKDFNIEKSILREFKLLNQKYKYIYCVVENANSFKSLTELTAIFNPRDVTPALLNSINKENSIFIYAIENNSEGIPIVELLKNENIPYRPLRIPAVGGYVYDDLKARNTVEEEFISQTSEGFAKFDFGSDQDFINLCQALMSTKHLEGDVVEIGTFQGSSGCIILNYANKIKLRKKFWFLDTFTGFDYSEALNSTDIIWANTHMSDGIDIVQSRLLSRTKFKDNVFVQRSNIITENLPNDIKKISLCNLDVDLYDAVYAGLFKVADYIVLGGIIICEDAGHTPLLIGARLALKEFLESPSGQRFTPVHMPSGQVFLIKFKE